MRITKTFVRLICIFLIGSILNSCAKYAYFEVPKSPPPQFQGRILKLNYPEKPLETFYFSDLSIANEQISGTLIKSEVQVDPRSKYIYNVYLNPGTALPDSLPAQFQLPLAQISRMEVYDLDLGRTILASTLVFAGVSTVLAAIVFLIVLLTKESCPFIYAYNGSEFEFTGEIYSGAIFPNLERDDFLPLPNLQAREGQYQLKMDNLAEEIQYTNLAELQVVDHPKGTELFVDRQGTYFSVQEAVEPLSALSGSGDDALQLVSAKDEFSYKGDDTQDPKQSMDALHLKFDEPKDKANAKLILKARNSIWLDYTLGQFLDLFGKRYDRWYARQAKPDKSLDKDWALKQGIPLSVYVKQAGEWRYLDHFPVVGPMADREMVLPLDLSDVQDSVIELKLQCGAKFWEIDYVALDASAFQPVFCQKVPLQKAETAEGKDVTKLLTNTDRKYFVQPKVGDSAVLSYAVPKPKEGYERSVFLHSRGHYKVIRKAKGEPDIAALELFRQAGHFAEFSRRNYLDFTAKYVQKR